MPEIHIGHIKKDLHPGALRIRCDRATPLGNPFEVGNDLERCIQAFRFYLYYVLVHSRDPLLAASLVKRNHDEFKNVAISKVWEEKQWTRSQVVGTFEKACKEGRDRDVSLDCWCVPKDCHCRIIRSAMLWKTTL